MRLPEVPARGAPISIVTDEKTLGFSEAAFAIVGELRVEGRLDRLDREGFGLAARLGGELQLECVRCLGPVGFPVEERLDLVYLPRTATGTPDADGSGERALEAADLNASFYDGDTLDLTEMLWEQLHLALPVKPLCAPDCLGLCPACGADRNEAPGCACESSLSGGGGLAMLGDLLRRGQDRR